MGTARVANPALSSGWKDLYFTRAEPMVSGYQDEGSPLGLLPRTTLINRLFLFMIFLLLSHKFALLQNMAISYWVLTPSWDSAKEIYLIWNIANDHKKYSVQNLLFFLRIYDQYHRLFLAMQSQAYTALYYMEDCCADITVLIPRDHTFPYITCQSPPSQSTSAGYKSALPEIIFNCKLDIS